MTFPKVPFFEEKYRRKPRRIGESLAAYHRAAQIYKKYFSKTAA